MFEISLESNPYLPLVFLFVLILIVAGFAAYSYRSLSLRIDEVNTPVALTDTKNEMINLTTANKESIVKLNQKIDGFINYYVNTLKQQSKTNVQQPIMQQQPSQPQQSAHTHQSSQKMIQQISEEDDEDYEEEDDIVVSDIKL